VDRIIEVKVNGNRLTKDNRYAGVQGESNVTSLRIEFDAGWDGYAKKVTFWNALGENPVERTLTTNLLEDITKSTRIYLCPIPGEPLEHAGDIDFVVDGYMDGKRQRSAGDKLTVKPSPYTDNAGEPADPTPTQAEQLQGEIDQIIGTIQEATQSAAAAAASEAAAKASEEAAEDSADSAGNDARVAAESARTAKEYSGNPPIIQNATWWIWDAEAKAYVDTGETASAVAVEANGLWGVDVVEDDLVLFYTGNEAPPLAVEDGELISEFSGARVNLGNVQGPQGERGPIGVRGPKGEPGVYYGTEEPADPDITVWINPDGDETTLVDEEVKDIRVGYDGTEYPTAGEAVRSQAETAVRYVAQTLTMEQQEQARNNIGAFDGVVLSASGEVIRVADSAERPLKGLRLFGKTTQDGTPTPDTPIELVSVGSGGTVEVTVAGKNLWDEQVRVGHYSDTTGEPATNNAIASANPISVTSGMVLYNSGSVTLYACFYDADGKWIAPQVVFNVGQSVTVPTNAKTMHFNISSSYGTTYKNDICIALEATTYEPHKEQTLTVQTPNGLPGIPVTSGGNYTDENGQQWVCDEVDFARGVLVHRVVKVAPTQASEGVGQHSNGTKYVETSANGVVGGKAPVSTHYAGAGWTMNNNHAYQLVNKVIVNDNRFTDLSTANAILAAEKPEFICILAEPIETPLSAEELAAYRALHSNYPNTTVVNGDGAGMELSYVADTKNYIDNKFAALAASLAQNS
jgi:hypothetical protein